MAVLAPDKVEAAPGISPEPITPLKPSEGIRLGAMVTRQGVKRLRGANQYAKWSCAVGAARDAMGGPNRASEVYAWFNELFPTYLDCPVDVLEGHGCYVTNGRASEVVVHMNDVHGLPREWIADYLESIGY